MMPSPFQRLLVTGACGAVGRLVLPRLCQWQASTLTDRVPGEVEGVPVAAVDLLDFAALLQAMQGCDAVLHLAIASGREFPDRTQPRDALSAFDAATLEVNTRGAYHLFEAARRAGVRRVIYMSSLTLFQGYPAARERARTDLPPCPTKLYAVTKWFGEEVGALYHRQHGLEVITLRLGQPYPLGTVHDPACIATPQARQWAVHRDDIVAGIRAALTTPVRYAVCPLTSRGEPYSVDPGEGERIGYTPAYLFRAEGVEKI